MWRVLEDSQYLKDFEDFARFRGCGGFAGLGIGRFWNMSEDFGGL